MTPTEFIDFVRQRHNVVGDNFQSDNEILGYFYDGAMQLSKEAYVIEEVTTTTSTSGTRSYSFPTLAIGIKRVEYNGQKLQKISFREDDLVTGLNADTTSSGTPTYYSIWDDTIYLRPTPAVSSDTIRIYYFKGPTALTTSSSSLEVPSRFHTDIADYVIAMLCAKEKNYDGAQFWLNSWTTKLAKAKQWQRKRLRTDSNANVMGTDVIADSFIGNA